MNTHLKKIIVVLGVPRSGTSAISRGLNALGVDFGDHLLAAREAWNPKGFWEDEEIVYKINRRIPLVLNETWTSVQRIDEACIDNEKLSGLKTKATQLLQSRMAQIDCWGFKDPRTARVLPFWQRIFNDLNLADHYVLALRNPLACASSWQRLNGTDIETGLLLWLAHIIPAVENTHHKKRVTVSFEQMLAHPEAQLLRLQEALALSSSHMDAIQQYKNEFLDKKLQHFQQDEVALTTHPAMKVVPLCADIYRLLNQVAKDEHSFSSPYFQSHWQVLMQEYARQRPIYAYIDSLLKRDKEWERQLRTIRRSIPWKLTYPLRVIDDILRAARRKQRIKRQLISA